MGMEADVSLLQVTVRVLPDGRMSRKDAALYLGLEPKTLANLASRKKGPPSVRVSGRVFYYRSELDAFIQGSAGDAQ